MASILDQRLNRRQFLAASVAAAAATTASRGAGDPNTSVHSGSDQVHVALLSDTHIPADPANEYRGFRPQENLKLVVPQVVAADPKLVILSGDAARLTGERADYQELSRLLAPLAEISPVAIGLGNHDDRRNFASVFSAPPERTDMEGRHVVVIEEGPLRFVVLDSLLYVNKVAGLLGKAQREWLARFLEESDDRPTLLFVHHTLGDRDSDLLDTDRLFQIIRPHSKVKAIFFGHSHRWNIEERDGVHLVNLPAVGYNFSDDQPVGWVDAWFDAKGAGLVLKAVGGNREESGWITTLEWA